MKYWMYVALTTIVLLLIGWFAGAVPHVIAYAACTLSGTVAASMLISGSWWWRTAVGVLVLGAIGQWGLHWAPSPYVILAGVSLLVAGALWDMLSAPVARR